MAKGSNRGSKKTNSKQKRAGNQPVRSTKPAERIAWASPAKTGSAKKK